MNFKKILFLFLALLLPVAVFLFLKGFGKNQFDVPLLFQDQIERSPDCTDFEYTAPYTVSNTVLTKLGWNKTDSVTIVFFDDLSIEGTKKIAIQKNRLRTEFSEEKLGFIIISDAVLKSCAFLMKSMDNAVLLDSKKRIRGQYDLTDIDEADRLIMELRIILKKY
jgi:hypothetical protein